jgi:AcrR family transcriptional regulator
LDAAFELFVRHGFRRTTMGDIAAGAEVSRPAVYLVFANKEEVFRAVVARYCEQARARAAARLERACGLRDQLAAVLGVWSAEVYDLINQSPEARELHQCTLAFAADVRKDGIRMFEEQLHQVIGGSGEVDPGRLAARGLTPEGLAHVIAACTEGIERVARDQQEVRRMLDALVAMACGLLGC